MGISTGSVKHNKNVGRYLRYFFQFLPVYLLVSCSSASEKTDVTGLDIALETLPFLEKMSETNGLALYQFDCLEDECTPSDRAYKQSRAWLVLAYIGLYDATGDVDYLTKAEKTMEKLQKDCPPDDPACHFVGVQAEAAYNVIGERQYLDYIKSVDPQTMPIFNQPGSTSIMVTGVRQAALAYKHGLYDKPEHILELLEKIELNQGNRTQLLTQDGAALKDGGCRTQLGFIEFYKAVDETVKDDETVYGNYDGSTIKAKMIKKPISFFSNLDFSGLSAHPRLVYVSLTEQEACAEALINLYDITGDEKYRRDAAAFLESILERHWDSQYSKKYVGDNSFLSQGCGENTPKECSGENRKVFTDNAYAVFLYTKLGDESFSVENPSKVPEVIEPRPDYKTTSSTLELKQEKTTTTSTIKPNVEVDAEPETCYSTVIAFTLLALIALGYVYWKRGTG